MVVNVFCWVHGVAPLFLSQMAEQKGVSHLCSFVHGKIEELKTLGLEKVTVVTMFLIAGYYDGDLLGDVLALLPSGARVASYAFNQTKTPIERHKFAVKPTPRVGETISFLDGSSGNLLPLSK